VSLLFCLWFLANALCPTFCFSAALGWFAYALEWYESPNKTYAQREAQSVSVFVHFLQNECTNGSADPGLKSQGLESEHSTV
jgi:phosphatidylinositol 4-kinase A